ncbi:DUF6338 family protein [Streptomyces sp. NPDC102451]|uniref:DUF6338 family protein n=1 Tax=Streptomyces sp. NPDC102451 TaxID=3366177 RepID=UPI0038174A39
MSLTRRFPFLHSFDSRQARMPGEITGIGSLLSETETGPPEAAVPSRGRDGTGRRAYGAMAYGAMRPGGSRQPVVEGYLRHVSHDEDPARRDIVLQRPVLWTGPGDIPRTLSPARTVVVPGSLIRVIHLSYPDTAPPPSSA